MFIEMAEREEQALRVRISELSLDSFGVRSVKVPPPMKRGQEVRQQSAVARGVYECEIAQAGHRAFHVVNSRGEVGYMQVPTAWVTRGFVRRLLHELDRQDRTQLHLIKPGA